MAIVTSKANGNWDAGSTWDSDPAVPSISDDVIIAHTVNITNAVQKDIKSLTINGGKMLTHSLHPDGVDILTYCVDLNVTNDITIATASQTVDSWDEINDRVNKVGHGLSDGDVVYFTTMGTLPSGVVVGTRYRVAHKAGDYFMLHDWAGDDVDIGAGASGSSDFIATAEIYCVGKGYYGGHGPGYSGDGRIGASHGGEGSLTAETTASHSALPYNYHDEPYDCGSGSGNAGGGVCKIIAGGTIAINGVISATATRNQSYGGWWSGSGSGGSIWINGSVVTGSGSLLADGGFNDHGAPWPGQWGTAGAGGRISIHYDTLTFSGDTYARSGYDGGGVRRSGGGTIFTKDNSDTYGDLTIDAGNINMVATMVVEPPFTFNNITINPAGCFTLDDPIIVLENMIISSGASLGHRDNIVGDYPKKLDLTVYGTLTVTGTIFAEHVKTGNIDYPSQRGAGYPGAETMDNNNNYGMTTGMVAGSTGGGGVAAGGSFGGKGGEPPGTTAADTYGSSTNPDDLGGGGARDTAIVGSYGGVGGGNIQILASTIVLDGVIQTDGSVEDWTGTRMSAAGAGGTVNIITQWYGQLESGATQGSWAFEVHFTGHGTGWPDGVLPVSDLTFTPDTGITVLSFVADAATQTATATIRVESDAPIGDRVVTIKTYVSDSIGGTGSIHANGAIGDTMGHEYGGGGGGRVALPPADTIDLTGPGTHIEANGGG